MFIRFRKLWIIIGILLFISQAVICRMKEEKSAKTKKTEEDVSDSSSEENSEKKQTTMSPEELGELEEKIIKNLEAEKNGLEALTLSPSEINEDLKIEEKLLEGPFPDEVESVKNISIEVPEVRTKSPEGEKIVEELSSPKITVTEESIEIPTTAASSVVSTELIKEEAPKGTYAVSNSKGKICLLAKFHAGITISYASKGGEEKVEVPVPHNGHAKGKCESSARSPILQVFWEKFVFTLMFNKTNEDSWIVSSVELTYDTSAHIFDRATNTGKMTARSGAVQLFESPIGKANFCPAQEVILLYSGNKQVVTARMKDIYLQPYGIEDGKFSSYHRCPKVVIGLDEEPFVQDETIPLAVGCTLALITLLILVGFSVHRAYHAAKVDYNGME